MQDSPYPRTPGSGEDYPPDRTWGLIFIILYVLMLLFFLVIILGIAGAFTFASVSQKGQSGGPMPALFGAGFAAIAGFVVIASLGAHIVGAVGVHRSKAWGFWATIILSVVSLGGSGGGTCLTIGPLIYCILRLAGALGPKPK